MARWGRTWSRGVALVAALVLVLQATLSAAALGAERSPVELDAFGNVLCITSHGASQSDSGGSDPSKVNCCTLGCSFTFQAFDAPSDRFLLVGALPSNTTGVVPPVGASTHVSRDYDPGNPRAPPLAA